MQPSSTRAFATASGSGRTALASDRVLGGYFDPVSGCRLLFAQVGDQPALWSAYLEGARRNYRQHGVESAVEYESIRDGHSTALFVPAVDGAGRVVGGLRVQGRLTRSDQAHAVTEWAGRPGTAQMCGQITARIPYGVIEVKTVWVDSTFEGRTALTSALSRAFVHVMDLLQVRFALCTAAGHAVTRWQASGGVVSRDVPAVAYPDERYRTVLMWWDRIRIADLVSADQLDAMTRESAALSASVATVPTASVA